MKTIHPILSPRFILHPSSFILFLLFLASFILHPSSFSSVPQPSVTYYGVARDLFGWPYHAQNKAVVTLLINGVEHDSCPVEAFLAPNVNYRFSLTVGDTIPTGIYDIPTVKVGDAVSFSIKADTVTYPVLQTNIPPVPASGLVVPVDLTAGHDTDLDGLPDEWETDLIEHSNGALHSIADVRPNDDFDHDGYTNLDEYRCGTIPYWNFDYLFIENTALLDDHYFAFDFLSLPGFSYGIMAATNLAAPSPWQPVKYSLTPGGTLQTDLFIGSGYMTTLYIPASNLTMTIDLQAY